MSSARAGSQLHHRGVWLLNVDAGLRRGYGLTFARKWRWLRHLDISLDLDRQRSVRDSHWSDPDSATDDHRAGPLV